MVNCAPPCALEEPLRPASHVAWSHVVVHYAARGDACGIYRLRRANFVRALSWK